MTLETLQQTLGYPFRDAKLLRLALTHRSLVREGSESSNQRLEFLGDAVLGLVIAEMLYALYPSEAEGDLSKRLVSLVNGEQLAAIAHTMQLGGAMLMSAGEVEQGGRENPSNLEDACEALLGAVYLDGGIEAARSIIHRFWQPYASAMSAPPKDAKTTLQEWAQARSLPLPEYALISAEGPSHAPLFIIELRVKGQNPVRAEAGVKKTAERLAAEKLLAQLS
ncbi:MAG: ribonuclease III [Rickettsiales bacterium]|nr:ribonuclease III [Rickettsiales bacterium]